MDPLKLLIRILWAALTAPVHRVLSGPRHVHWGWKLELSAAAMRASFGQIAPMGAVRYRAASEALAPQLTGGVPCREVLDGPLVGHWLEPEGADDLVIVYLHGGGFIFGSIRSHGNLAGHLASAAGARVFLPRYPLAPEHPLPAAIHHAADVIRALVDQGQDPARIVVVGDSAGGNLVLTVLSALRDSGGPIVAGGLAISPWTDLTNTGPSFSRFAKIDYCTKEACDEAARCALSGADGRDPRLSPLYGDLRGLPPILVQAGGAECLLDQILALGDRAREQGADIEVRVAPGMVHVWHMLVGTVSEADVAIQEAADWIRRLVGR
ncbi:MAG: alpha/beta hydrolase [Myxococcales bacterium]|nr:alpha/beta hydrolase [Myxococcales bacterium]MCB9672880.1 alpha/beta hydrolase [Alphaproteobacteria bacterium]MCB9694130.1 alpha/beta hydrolase [Alphaproteobacteria bacterium]